MNRPITVFAAAAALCFATAQAVELPKLHPEIRADDFNALVAAFSHDDLQGRAPGTVGEERTLQALQDAFARAGLKPGNRGSWFQTVPMVVSRADPATVMTLSNDGASRTLAYGEDMVVGTRTAQPQVSVQDSPMVFVGYGVDAPEQQWNDYAGLDVKGKTVVMFVNDPGFHANDATLFEGARMTWYGRWVYKFEEAARKGATAAILIHDDAGAAYGWDVVRNSNSGDRFDLPVADDPAPRLPVQGWISNAQARRLFAESGLDYDAMLKAAGQRGFKPVPLQSRMSVDLRTSLRETTSKNVIGILPGRTRPQEAVIYQGHWDHLGIKSGTPGEDHLYNGAVDNATGLAAMVEVAHRMSSAKRRPERSVIFFAPTLEESGLIGSQYYVHHPVVPLAQTAAVINFDAMVPMGRTRDVMIIGRGNSALEDLLEVELEKQGRVLADEPTPQDGFYFRSDHFNFAKAGVPALYGRSGTDLRNGGRAAGDALAAAYVRERYHKPSDEYDASWDSSGIVEDLKAYDAVGWKIANGRDWPRWRENSAFRAPQKQLERARNAARKP